MKFKMLILIVLLLFAITPAFAQDDDTLNTVAFNGFSFSFDDAVATNVNITQYAGDPADSPFVPDPAHTQFLLYSASATPTPAPESLFDRLGGVRVYHVADVQGSEAREAELVRLQSLLSTRPDLSANMVSDTASNVTLPFLPVVAAGQLLRARAQYVETEQVTGISYLTVITEVAEPFDAGDVIYTFQGLSADGEYYISAVFHVNPSALPAELQAFDPTTFDMNAYATDIIAQLNAAAPEDFSPSLTNIDAIVQSFSFAQ
jgi:hypothetical protein